MGTFAFFMGGLQKQGQTIVLNANYPSKLYNFLTSCNVDVNKFRNYCDKLSEVSELRNACAHPSLQDESYAIKAKVVVYKHEPSDDSRIASITKAVNVYKMIFKLLDLWP